MKPRTIVTPLVVIALGLLAFYIARNTHWENMTVPAPLRGEALTNPFYAAQKFAEALGATTERRRTLGTLTDAVDVLVLSNWHWDLIDARRRELKQWVEAGGHLVVDNTLIGDEDFANWSGVGWDYPESDEATDSDARAADEESEPTGEREAAPATPPNVPVRALSTCGALREVDREGNERPESRTLDVCYLDVSSFLDTDEPLAWGLSRDGYLQAVRVAVGSGTVTVLNAEPFGNRELDTTDHGKLFVAATQLRRGDRIAFLTEEGHPSLLGLMWLHGAPVVLLFIALIAALLWRGGVRFGPLVAPTETARRSLAEQIRGTGRFAMRLGDGKALHVATIRALHEAARKRIPRYESLPHAERIGAIARASGLDEDALATAINHTGARRGAALADTIALLETARRRILE